MARITLLLLLLAASVPAVLAQTNSLVPNTATAASPDAETPAADDVPIFRAQVREVNVIFTATDKRGRFKKDLRASDLRILDDGRPPAAVRSFQSQTDLPLRVGLVMDVSGSITDRFTFEQGAAISFFNQVVHPNTDRGFVVAFDSVPTLTQDFTDKPELLASGVKALEPGGGSAVYDAVQFAASKKLAQYRDDKAVRRVILLISDGEDNQSRATRDEVIEAARRAEVTVYAISSHPGNVKTSGNRMLERLAEETGGRVFFPNTLDEVGQAFKAIEEELRSQYAVSYKPAGFLADGRFRRIEIRTTNQKDTLIRARKGYFAPSR